MKVTAQHLEEAGYTQDQIDRYYKLLDRKTKFGLDALTINDRRFYNKSRVDAHRVETLRSKQLSAAKTRAVFGKQPVEIKLHYRWVEVDLNAINLLSDCAPDEVNAMAIILDEHLAALRKFQPVLDQVDTTRRGKMRPMFQDLLALAKSMGRTAVMDYDRYLELLCAEFPELTSDNDFYRNPDDRAMVMIQDTEELEFRALVRVQMEDSVRTTFPSVALV